MATVNPADSLNLAFRRVHQRTRRMAVLTGLVWCIAAALAVMLLLGMLDWLIHIDAPVVRTVLVSAGSIVWLLLAGIAVIAPALKRRRAAETALSIERVWPQWRGALASSVEFAAADCSADFGSTELQQALIARVEAQFSAIEVDSLVDKQSLRWATAGAIAVVVMSIAVVTCAPEAAGVALARMVSPRAGPGWPREHTLVLLDSSFQAMDPQTSHPPAPLGERLLIYVDDAGGNLPEDVLLHIAGPNGSRKAQRVELTTISDRTGRQRSIGVAALPTDAKRIQVRAGGGHALPVAGDEGQTLS